MKTEKLLKTDNTEQAITRKGSMDDKYWVVLKSTKEAWGKIPHKHKEKENFELKASEDRKQEW